MADGTLKPIEQVQVGDVVLSKDESTGEVAPKRISHTFKRHAPSTLVLSFGNGERIETTTEHPFYVAQQGFTPAGLLAIGNSIVTRAGPTLAITGIDKKSTPATVYNLTVEDFHTYFVGGAALWVHNANYEEVWNTAADWGKAFRSINDGPAVAAAIDVPGLGRFRGVSNTPPHTFTIHGAVDDLFNLLTDTSGFHKQCAEVEALSDIARALSATDGNDLIAKLTQIKSTLPPGEKIQSFAVNIKDSHPKGFGSPRSACLSCRQVLSMLGIADSAKGPEKAYELGDKLF